MNEQVRNYLAEIGRRGGKRSKRVLSPEAARDMVRVREARKAFKRFHTLCFWYTSPDLTISKEDVSWVAETLKKNGNRDAWEVAERLCR